MASRRLVSASTRETLFGIPSDTASLERNYVLADDDLDLICTRRSAENRLGLAIHIALLRHSTRATSLHSLLARLGFLRAIGLPPDLGQNIHPARLARFAREGEVAPINLLNDFGERRRMASLAAQMLELDIVLTDAAIAMFERLTGQLFTRSKNKQDQSWSAGKARIGRLVQLFGGTIDAMMRAREQDQDPFAVLDTEIGWTRLLQSRDEIAAFGDLATEGPLSLASKRYVQLRRFAPAFLEAFEFSVPEGGKDLLVAVTLLKEQNRTGKRKLPDIVPMPFSGKHWESLILEDGRPSRRVYETAVIATLRDRLRAGDVWVEGSRDYRRFDAYLPPVDEAENVLANSGLETDGPTWLDERRERLHHRLREVRQKRSHLTKRKKSYAKENRRLWRCQVEAYPSLTSGTVRWVVSIGL